ncbi:hypothetical protein N9W96_03535 [Flavobacteriaceae bacterium]|nr:hypothetical protein [Flavobacteriaceae bacterium]
MSIKMYKIIIVTFFVPITLLTCQDEIVEISETNEESVIIPNSTFVSSMQSTVTNDGSVDDIMDDADCFSVDLPVTVLVNDLSITINTLSDLQLIEDIYNEFDTDEDSLEFSFPITIILYNYENIVIQNQTELVAFTADCDNLVTDLNQCIDFRYPISFSIYNTEFQITETIFFENDETLYYFLDSIQETTEENVLASLNFPVTMVYTDGSIIDVFTNQELENVINEVGNDCDNDSLSLGCIEVSTISLCDENNDGYEVFNLYDGLNTLDTCTSTIIVSFYESQNDAENSNNPITNTTAYTNNTLFQIIYVRVENGENSTEYDILEINLNLESCNDNDCTKEELDAKLLEDPCYWEPETFNGNDDYDDYTFDFNEGTLNVDAEGYIYYGQWSSSQASDGVVTITISDLENNIANFNGDWLVIECEPEKIVLSNGVDEIMFEQECQ